MRCAIALAAGLLLSSAAFCAELSDIEAKAMAVRMEQTLAESRQALNLLIDGKARDQWHSHVRMSVQRTLTEWPAEHLDNRAIFPYFSCRQAAASLLQYGDAWARNDGKAWSSHVVKNFRSDYAACRAAIIKPDLSLKDIR